MPAMKPASPPDRAASGRASPPSAPSSPGSSRPAWTMPMRAMPFGGRLAATCPFARCTRARAASRSSPPASPGCRARTPSSPRTAPSRPASCPPSPSPSAASPSVRRGGGRVRFGTALASSHGLRLSLARARRAAPGIGSVARRRRPSALGFARPLAADVEHLPADAARRRCPWLAVAVDDAAGCRRRIAVTTVVDGVDEVHVPGREQAAADEVVDARLVRRQLLAAGATWPWG